MHNNYHESSFDKHTLHVKIAKKRIKSKFPELAGYSLKK